MSRQTVLLIFGGESSEHDISIMSARNVYAAMDNEKYSVELCYIDRKGVWWLLETWQESLDDHDGRQLVPALGESEFLTVSDMMPLHVDVIFPVLHGENGHEDGTVQSLANLMHIPVIGCGVGASAVCWDKLYTKQLLAENGISVAPYVLHQASDELPRYEEVAAKLGAALFVKPTIAGSSIGVSKVHNEAEFLPAIELALKYSARVLIETSITGRELEVAVLGNPPHHKESGVGEILPGKEFYDFEDKYADDSKAQVITNAELSSELRDKIRSVAHRAYEVLDCRGLARVDFLVDEDQIYVNELNTLPGFTNISQYPKLWAEQGTPYSSLIDRLIELALEK